MTLTTFKHNFYFNEVQLAISRMEKLEKGPID